jgi:hypothetical protein
MAPNRLIWCGNTCIVEVLGSNLCPGSPRYVDWATSTSAQIIFAIVAACLLNIFLTGS